MSELQIRPLGADEILRFSELASYAFGGRLPDAQFSDHERRAQQEKRILVAVEAGQIVSQLLIHSFVSWIDGASYPTGGLAAVSTAPEKTRHGYASQLLRATLAWMRDELGMTLSTLYATVYPLYSRLGWAIAEDTLRYSGPPSAFRPARYLPSDPGGKVVRRIAQPEDVALLEPVYLAFAKTRSGYLERPRWYWEENVLRIREATQPRWVGLWYGADGQLGGYVLYTREASPDEHLRVREFVALRPEAYPGLLSFLSTHHLWKKIVVNGGADVPWRSMVVDPHQLSVSAPMGNQYLLRILDFQRAIAGRVARGNQSLPDITVRIHDEAAPWNDGVWRIGRRGNRWGCENAPRASAPDVTLDIATAASLFSGLLKVRQAVDVGAVTARADAVPTLEALFSIAYGPHSNDSF